MPKRSAFPYTKRITSRGKVYEYFDTGKRVNGRPVYAKLPPRADKSWGQVYAGMVAARHARQHIVAAKTMLDLSREYQRNEKFFRRSASTQATYLIYIKVIESALGMAEVDQVERRDIVALLDSMADRPGAANMALLVLRNMFKRAIKNEWIKVDPTVGIDAMETEEAEYEPWDEALLNEALTDPEVRLPVALMYYTAQRIGDVCKMRWSDVRDGFVYVKQQKTDKELDIQVHEDLRAILAETPKAAMTIMHRTGLRPVRPATLRLQLQKWASERGHQIVPHGLRKNAVNMLLEVGCSAAETSAISGQSLKMVEHYAKRRNNRRIGSAAILKWQETKGVYGKRSENA